MESDVVARVQRMAKQPVNRHALPPTSSGNGSLHRRVDALPQELAEVASAQMREETWCCGISEESALLEGTGNEIVVEELYHAYV